MTALIMASLGGHIECVEALLVGGAQTNIQDKVSSTKAVRYLLLMWLLAIACGMCDKCKEIVCLCMYVCDPPPPPPQLKFKY